MFKILIILLADFIILFGLLYRPSAETAILNGSSQDLSLFASKKDFGVHKVLSILIGIFTGILVGLLVFNQYFSNLSI